MWHLFGPRIQVEVTILGAVGTRMVRYQGQVAVKADATVKQVLKAAGRAAGANLVAALAAGAEPAVLLNGQRLDLPEGLRAPVEDGAALSWLMPLAGG